LPVLVLALFGALLAACGGGGSGTKTAASNATTTTNPGAKSFAAYAQCVQAHGGQVRQRPDSSSSTSSTSSPSSTVDQATQQAAQQACASLRPAGGAGGGLGNSPQSAAYRNCLQQHGVTLPTGGQTPGGTNTGAPPGGSFTSNPAFQAAQQACAALRPARSSTTSTT
jgi:hypothetical protein